MRPSRNDASYDAAGNMTKDNVNTLTYDAENGLVNYMGSSATYTFDGNGLRVTKAASGSTTVYIFSGAKVIAEYDNGAAPASPSREYIYSGATLLAKIESGAAIYYHPDHLSNRVLTDSSGNSLGQRGHYPFGETWYESGTTTKIKFTTYERDSESSNDYAMARTYINRFGRFPSTDPIAGSLGDPQSLNRYTYGRNVPVSVIDPSGMKTDCTILQKRDTTNSQEVAGGPMADAGGSDPSEAEAQQGWGCGSSTSSGFPLGGGNIFDLLAFAFTPTFSGDFYVQGNYQGEPFSGEVNVTLYGNLSLLSLLGSGTAPGMLESDFIKSVYDSKQKKMNDCIRTVFGSDASHISPQSLGNAPGLDTTQSAAKLGAQSDHPNEAAAGLSFPNKGPNGTVAIARDYYYYGPPTPGGLAYLQGIYIHELGNILSFKQTGSSYSYGDPNGIGRAKDKDTGANFQNCVFPSSINF